MFDASRFFRPLAAFAFAVLAVPLLAQPFYPIEGYIGAIHSPTSFEVDGRLFYISSQTSFGLMGHDSTSSSSPLRGALQIGAYVQVAGSDPGAMRPIKATTILIRDDRNLDLSGIGVITRIVSPAPDAVFEADGYLIRITPSTHLAFAGDLDSLADVSANTWISFSGKRGKDGILEARKAQLIPAKPTKFKAVKNLEVRAVKTRPVGAQDNATTSQAMGAPAIAGDGADLKQDEELKIGLGHWHTLPADQPLQQRVHRVGMALVPTYQREMADDDPSKIHFRFFAVDNDKLHGGICLLDGVVIVSKQTIERLANDDQLAAVLAAGVANHLQRQAARAVMAMRKELGIDIALDIANAFVPGVGLAKAFGLGMSAKDEPIAMIEERMRISLALMRDAGFDPWLAPEAWRMALPKKLPANLDSLAYPSISCYQLGILDMQYSRKGPGESLAPSGK